MTGGLMQLVAYGAQDIYLTGNPLITYFKSVYRRHTNFAVETIENTFEQTVTFGTKASALIARSGDLLSSIYLQVTLPDLTEKALADFGLTDDGYTMPNRRYTRWIDNIGHFLIKSAEVEIGGQLIDRHYGDWLEIWAQLTVPASKQKGYRQMIGQDPKNAFGQNTGLQADIFRTSNESVTTAPTGFPSYTRTSANVLVGREIYIPLQFWFCRDYGLALPLVSLQHHEVKINIEFSRSDEVIMTYEGDSATNNTWATSVTDHSRLVDHEALTVSLWIDYIYLDTDERRKFAQVAHEYLIEQLQYNYYTVKSGLDTTPKVNTVNLFFDHPVKELVWVVKGFESNKEWSNYTNTQINATPPFISTAIDQQEDEDALPNVPQTGLSGLPSGPIEEAYLDIDLKYQTFLSGTISSGTTLTVTDDEDATTNTIIYFSVQDNTRFSTGDLVIINDGDTDNNLPLLVTAIDSNSHPSTFRLMAATGTTLLTNIYRVDRVGASVTETGASGIVDMELNGLDSVVTYHDLIDFCSFDGVRPYNQNGLAQNPVQYAKIRFNNHDRFDRKPGSYFNLYQCKKHHTAIPYSPGINVYSFAFKPEEHQPSGACNFSRIDNAKLILWIGGIYNGGSTGTQRETNQTLTVKVYAKNYNILRIMSGMAGLAYV